MVKGGRLLTVILARSEVNLRLAIVGLSDSYFIDNMRRMGFGMAGLRPYGDEQYYILPIRSSRRVTDPEGKKTGLPAKGARRKSAKRGDKFEPFYSTDSSMTHARDVGHSSYPLGKDPLSEKMRNRYKTRKNRPQQSSSRVENDQEPPKKKKKKKDADAVLNGHKTSNRLAPQSRALGSSSSRSVRVDTEQDRSRKTRPVTNITPNTSEAKVKNKTQRGRGAPPVSNQLGDSSSDVDDSEDDDASTSSSSSSGSSMDTDSADESSSQTDTNDDDDDDDSSEEEEEEEEEEEDESMTTDGEKDSETKRQLKPTESSSDESEGKDNLTQASESSKHELTSGSYGAGATTIPWESLGAGRRRRRRRRRRGARGRVYRRRRRTTRRRRRRQVGRRGRRRRYRRSKYRMGLRGASLWGSGSPIISQQLEKDLGSQPRPIIGRRNINYM